MSRKPNHGVIVRSIIPRAVSWLVALLIADPLVTSTFTRTIGTP